MTGGAARLRWLPPPDGSRDPRIEDPTNRWIVHLAGRALLPLALKARVPANAVSVGGLALGAASAGCFYGWRDPALVLAGLLLAFAWMIADGLDGMIARATTTASPLGRFLDGLCDHAVFLLLYLALAASLGGVGIWILALAAGAAHAVQATLYEGERTRFHRRIAGTPATAAAGHSANPLVRLYDAVAGGLDKAAAPFERRFAESPDRSGFARAYGDAAARPLRLMALLTNNMRVVVMAIACLARGPALFWWIELGPMSVIAATGIWWHRRVERRLIEAQI